MLATFLLSKSTKTQIILPFQRLNITFNVIRTNSSSSSSSSSDSSSSTDSDSDAEISNKTSDKLKGIDYLQSAKAARKRREIEYELTKAAQILTATSDQDKGKILSALLDNINKIQTVDNILSKSNEDKAKNKTRTIDNKSRVPQKSSIIRDVNDKFERKRKTKKEPSIIEMLKTQSSKVKDINDKFGIQYRGQMKSSTIYKLKSQQKEVGDVGDKLGRKHKTQKESSIIEMLKTQSSKVKDIDDKFGVQYKEQMKSSIIYKLKSRQREVRDVSDKFEIKYERRMKPSIIHKLQSQQMEVRDVGNKFGRMHKTQKEPAMVGMLPSVTRKKPPIIEKQMWQQRGSSVIDDNESDNTDYERIFDDFLENTDIPKFKMWDTWEREELQFSISKYPTNAFQEMIEWSKEGKLWKFPIDNEQGMEKEQNVHFSKHVFLERELTPWCPSKGPIRHFMELVCVGLSKNPYMTIEEKYDHIMWYKNYFEEKHDLLEKLGVVG